MKITLAFVAFLPYLSAAVCLAERDQASLPTVDIQTLSAGQYRDAGVAHAAVNIDAESDVAAPQSCPPNYPWLCDGRCCQYNRCCPASCCSPIAEFCGSDGHCYYYT